MISFIRHSGKGKHIGIGNSGCKGVGEGLTVKWKLERIWGRNGTVLYVDCGSGVSVFNSLKLVTTVVM